MMLGKRPRPPLMKRTTSMSGIMTVDVSSKDDEIQSTPLTEQQHSMAAMLSPRYSRRAVVRSVGGSGGGGNSNSLQTPVFLKTCGLCNCRLAPGRDIFMYRGDTPFCSQECREQRMKQDERKEKSNQKPTKNNAENHHQ